LGVYQDQFQTTERVQQVIAGQIRLQQALFPGKRGVGDSGKRGNRAELVERDQAHDGNPRIFILQDRFTPLLRVGPFQGQAGSEPRKAVRAGQHRPQLFQGCPGLSPDQSLGCPPLDNRGRVVEQSNQVGAGLLPWIPRQHDSSLGTDFGIFVRRQLARQDHARLRAELQQIRQGANAARGQGTSVLGGLF